MKFSAVTLVAVAAVASAQSIADIPACAQTCLLPALQATGCSLTDFKCSCSNEDFVSGSTACILKACSPSDAEKAAKATYELCQSVGVTIHTQPIPGATTSAAAAPSSSEAAPASSSAEAAPVSSSAAEAPSSSAAAAPTYGAAPTSSAAAVPTSYAAPSTIHTTCTTKAGNATAPTQAPPVQTGAGVVVVANAVLAVGGAVAAFFL
ncbi:hypothetical protein AA313_de0208042 [Arthrobotrys entomopaga]|nr:hypothetical protein AA313_de0208042 [Arthrobotrys entomopaga]